jgi:hypothetical protein
MHALISAGILFIFSMSNTPIFMYSFTLSVDFVCRLFLVWMKLKEDEIGRACSTHQGIFDI